MEIEARHVRRKQLSQYLDKELLNRERKSAEAQCNSSSANPMKRRIGSNDSQQQQQQTQQNPASKRNRTDNSVSN